MSKVDSDLVDATTGWEALGLDERVLKAIARSQWRAPTLVQAHAVPLALKGRDILAKARTGSGKTGAYLVPIVQRLLSEQRVRSLPARASPRSALSTFPCLSFVLCCCKND